MIRKEFTAGHYNDLDEELAEAFSVLFGVVERLLPVGRERSLVLTKLQEAQDWSMRGTAQVVL